MGRAGEILGSAASPLGIMTPSGEKHYAPRRLPPSAPEGHRCPPPCPPSRNLETPPPDLGHRCAPPSNPLAHPYGPSTLAASILGDKPISPQLADAFFAAVRGYVRWGYMGPKPGITNEGNELIPISTVCRRVDTFTDPLPDEVCNALCFLTTQKHLKEKLDAERTYATGAQLLLKLIEDRKAQWGEVWAEAQSR